MRIGGSFPQGALPGATASQKIPVGVAQVHVTMRVSHTDKNLDPRGALLVPGT